MRNAFYFRRVFFLMMTAGIISFHENAMAAAFQLWEQDAANLGNYHAGATAIADDASTNWYNPAGLIRIKNQQIVLGADPVLTDFRFRGTVNNLSLINPDTSDLLGPQPVVAQGGNPAIVPFFHYATPINRCLAFGFSATVPFGLETNYGSDSFVRYSASLTQVKVIDLSASLAFAINDKLSFALGPNWQKLTAELNEYVGAFDPSNDSLSKNQGTSYAWGYHAGLLYQFTPKTRLGLDYHSKFVHHLYGHSTLTGPIANGFNGGSQYSDSFRSTATLPAITSLGIFHSVNNCWDIMGNISYIQWSVFKDLILQNVAGLQNDETMSLVATNSLIVTIPEHYRNSWNYSVGANFHPNEKWILRTGLGYDQSPASDTYRNLQLPDSDRIAIALGGHYQATKTVGFDLGWTHIFAMNTRINNITQAFGPELVTTNGSVKSSADAYGLSVKWDLV